ncbi:MAG: undecaprenyl-diphosphate [Candidatus Paraimprobicoccus trichonymphae]|uniref:Undecaprenyl-diphosphatase n=1 Tax=Candidatus Paraimprobicoccus trichonymphae TaxID=3033793 RepID=A0AA48I312_9FIRM|nr:MAG: undecaprenyl-diphosphate [Candidatus Paraimprobicoccus trichonymphae]
MNILSSVIQGIVQGLTEFLPVSSSGHLLLIQYIFKEQENNLFFNVMLHLGTLFSVICVYYKLFLRLILAFFEILKDLFRNNFRFNKLNKDKQMAIMIIVSLLPLFLLFLPLPGNLKNLKNLAEILSNSGNITLVGICLMITSFLLFISNKKFKREYKSEKILYLKNTKKIFNIFDALSIGLTQLIASIFPGISRSGSTLSIALLRGIDKKTAIDFSFVIGTPAIIAAVLLELKEINKLELISDINIFDVLIGICTSAIVGFFSIKIFKYILDKNKTNIFIIYTFFVGLISIIIGIFEN